MLKLLSEFDLSDSSTSSSDSSPLEASLSRLARNSLIELKVGWLASLACASFLFLSNSSFLGSFKSRILSRGYPILSFAFFRGYEFNSIL